MRQLIGSVFQSLDGVMQGPGGPDEDRRGGFALGGWVAPLWDAATSEALDALFSDPYELLLGRRTYEIFAAYWPYVAPENGLASAFNRTAKHVLTHQSGPLEWENSHRLPNVEAVRALKAGEGPTLLIQGSASLYPQLLGAGLIDRLTTLTFPIVLGQGRTLFGPGTPPVAFRQTAARTSPNGIVIATYEPVGEVRTEPIAEDIPSEAELRRRADWALEDVPADH